MQEVASIQSGRGLATSMINSWTILGNLCLKVPYSTWKFILIILISVLSHPFTTMATHPHGQVATSQLFQILYPGPYIHHRLGTRLTYKKLCSAAATAGQQAAERRL